MAQANLQIVLDDCEIPGNLNQALCRVDAAVHFARLADAGTWRDCQAADAIVVVPANHRPESSRAVAQLLNRLADHPKATLLWGDDDSQTDTTLRLGRPPLSLADAMSADELAGHLSTMLAHGRRLSDGGYERLTGELAEARRIQRSLLPKTIPTLAGYRLASIYRPACEVSGDIYGFAQNQDTEAGVWLADVCGHGIGAAMMTGFVKRCMSAATWRNGNGTLNDPEAVLEQLNTDLLNESVEEAGIVAAGWTTIEAETGLVRWARGGLPYPILVTPGQPAQVLATRGTIMGAFARPTLTPGEVRLRPGQSLILSTDGLDAAVCGRGPGQPSTIERTDWFAGLEHHSVTTQLAKLDEMVTSVASQQRDDLSIIVIEYSGRG